MFKGGLQPLQLLILITFSVIPVRLPCQINMLFTSHNRELTSIQESCPARWDTCETDVTHCMPAVLISLLVWFLP